MRLVIFIALLLASFVVTLCFAKRKRARDAAKSLILFGVAIPAVMCMLIEAGESKTPFLQRDIVLYTVKPTWREYSKEERERVRESRKRLREQLVGVFADSSSFPAATGFYYGGRKIAVETGTVFVIGLIYVLSGAIALIAASEAGVIGKGR